MKKQLSENPEYLCWVPKKSFFSAGRYKHDWLYKGKEERVCSRCGRAEMLFGESRFDGDSYEDWRKKFQP